MCVRMCKKKMRCLPRWLRESEIDREHTLADCLLMRWEIYGALIDGSNLRV